jgi:steroid delta-isomerase-like uncharacterized protein
MMTREATQSVMDGYLTALRSRGSFAQYFSDDIVVTIVDANQQIAGKDAARAAIIDLHQTTFNASIDIKHLIVGDAVASAEALFTGTHEREFAGIPANGREVHVPYAAFWTLADDKITELRLYGFVSGIVQQLTADQRESLRSHEELVATAGRKG